MRDGIGKGTGFHSKIPQSRYLLCKKEKFFICMTSLLCTAAVTKIHSFFRNNQIQIQSWTTQKTFCHLILRRFLSCDIAKLMQLLSKLFSFEVNCVNWGTEILIKKRLRVSIGNPAGIGKGTGFRLRERDRDGIVLGHYRLRANQHKRKNGHDYL